MALLSVLRSVIVAPHNCIINALHEVLDPPLVELELIVNSYETVINGQKDVMELEICLPTGPPGGTYLRNVNY